MTPTTERTPVVRMIDDLLSRETPATRLLSEMIQQLRRDEAAEHERRKG